jgi:hypothetical protein
MLTKHAWWITRCSFVQSTSSTQAEAYVLSAILFLSVHFFDWLCNLGHVASLFLLGYLSVNWRRWRRRLTLTQQLPFCSSLTLNNDVVVGHNVFSRAVVGLLGLIKAMYRVFCGHTLQIMLVLSIVSGANLSSSRSVWKVVILGCLWTYNLMAI